MPKFSEVPKFILNDFLNKFYTAPLSDTGSVLVGPMTTIVEEEWTYFYGVVEIEDLDGIVQKIEIPFSPAGETEEDHYSNNFFYLERMNSMETSATSALDIPAETSFYLLRRKGGVVQEYVDNLVENGSSFTNTIDMDYFINPHKIHQYIGKIYPQKEANQYRIDYWGYDRYALTCIPEHNQTTKLKEFFKITFDQVYNAFYNRAKTIKTLIDAKEIPLDYLPYLAEIYNYQLSKSYFESLFIDKVSEETRARERRLKELVANIINYLKRKGTYSSLYIAFKTLFWATENNLNVYERWHPSSVFDLTHEYDLEPYFIDFNYLNYYDALSIGCTGSEYYTLASGIGFNVPLDNCYIHKQNYASDKWYIAHSLDNRTPVIQCFDSDMNLISPTEVACIDSGSCLLTFYTSVTGFALIAKPQYMNPLLSSSELHSHGLDQIAPLVEGYYPTTFTYNTTSIPISGICTFETVMPSGMNDILVANTTINSGTYVVALSGDYFHIQDIDKMEWEIEHNLDSKALMADFYLSTPASAWTITHTLGTKDLVYQIYSEDETITECSSLYNVTNDVVKVGFADKESGRILLIEADETLTLPLSSGWMSTYMVSGGDIQLLQVYDTEYNAINDVDIRPLYTNTLVLSTTSPFAGYLEVAIPDYTKTELYYSNIWNINHDLNSLNIITNVYKNIVTSNVYTFFNEFHNTEILVNVYNEYRKQLQPELISITPHTITVTLSADSRIFVCVSPADSTLMQISEDNWVLEEEASDIDGDLGDELLIEITPLDEYTKIVSVPQNVSEYSGTYPSSAALFDYSQVMDFVHVQEELSDLWWVEHYLDTYELNVKFFTSSFYGDEWHLYHILNEVTIELYDVYSKERLTPLSLYNEYFTDYAYQMDITFSETCSGFICMASGTKIEQLVPGSPWTITHSLGQKEQIIQLYSDAGEMFTANTLSLIDANTASMFTSGSAPSANCYAVITTPDYIEDLVPTSTDFTITHNLDSPGVICQVYDNSYELIDPSIIKIIDNDSVYFDFDSILAGCHVLVKEAQPALYQIMPEEVLLYNKNWVKGSFDRKYSGYVGINVAATTFIPTIKDNEPDIEIVDENNIIVTFPTSAIGYIACGIADSACTNLFQGSPENFQVIDKNNATASFISSASGMAILREVGQLTYADGLLMSPHYKAEIDLNCEPLCDRDILTKDYALMLHTQFEASRPASKYAHYALLLSPITDFSEEVVKTYDIDGGFADFYTYCCVDTESTSAGFIYRKYIPTAEWTIFHGLNTENVLVQCYDNTYEMVFPLSVKIIDTNNVSIEFFSPFSGLCLIGSARETLTNTYEASASWGFTHSQETSAVLSDYYFYLDKEQILPSNVSVTEVDQITSTWYVPTLGYCQIRNSDYLHVQSTASTEWIITHTLDHKGVMVQLYDDELKQIFPKTMTLFRNKKQITVTFEESKSGYAFVTCLGGLYTKEYVIESLSNGYIEIGNGTSTENYDAISNNVLKSPMISPHFYDLVITEDFDKYYVKGFFNGNKDETAITEMGLFNADDELMFYTYIRGELYKTSNFDITAFYRINKNV